jgi:hypothetical protein
MKLGKKISKRTVKQKKAKKVRSKNQKAEINDPHRPHLRDYTDEHGSQVVNPADSSRW